LDQGFIGMHDFSIIIVNYNTKNLLNQCLNSILSNPGTAAVEIIVVDNKSEDDSVSFIREFYPSVILIENNKNLGFGKACNQGIKISKGKYIILLNSDCEVFEHTLAATQNILEKIETSVSVGIIGGKILNPDGTLQYSYGKFPNVISTILDMFKPPKRRKVQTSGYNSPHYVDWVTGAFMIIDRELFAEIGTFDENYFMYYEETDLCFRAKAQGWKVLFDPTPRVIHKTPHTFKKENTPLFIQAEIRKSHLYFFRKNRSLFSFMIISIASLKLLVFKWLVYLFIDSGRRKEIEKLISVVWITFIKLVLVKK